MAGDAETVLAGGRVLTAPLSKPYVRPLAIRSRGLAGALLHQLSVEVRDTGKDFIVRVELPGMTKEDIDVQATEGSLRVFAEQEDETIEVGQVASAERLARQFERTAPLPEHVVPSKAAAAVRDGGLDVTPRRGIWECPCRD
jgi:HSP20 family molecular chaperone IbpA